jgi:hypothetical protein
LALFKLGLLSAMMGLCMLPPIQESECYQYRWEMNGRIKALGC